MVFRGALDAPLNPRLEPMAAALEEAGLAVVPVPFAAGQEAELGRQLAAVDGALVWADPLADDGDRAALDEELRAAVGRGVWVSARPDVIDRLGTKEVLVTTSDLGWGSDAHLYRDPEQLRREFPARLARDRVRVLKAARGNGGRTVWKVRLAEPSVSVVGPDTEVLVQHARVRDGAASRTTLAETLRQLDDGGGPVVDQEFVPGITRGIVRCYLVGDAVVGFARQYPRGVVPDGPLDVVPESMSSPDEVMGLPSPKTMYGRDESGLAGLRRLLETEWVPAMATLLGLAGEDLPALWDVDLLIADSAEGGGDATRFVLCEINASSVIPFPPEAPVAVARHVSRAVARRRS